MPDAIPPLPPDPLADFAGVPSSKLSSTKRLKMAVVGDTGAGKSWFAVTAPKPVYIFDFDGRLESIIGKPGFYIEEKPSMINVETALNMAKYHKETGKPLPATWVFDSITYMNKAMEDEIFKYSTGTHKEIKVGSKLSMKVRTGWDAINAIQRYIELIITEFSALGNLIFVFHEKDEKDPTKSTPKETVYTGGVTVSPQYLANSLSLFNEVFRAYIDSSNQYKIQCKQTYEFPAKTSMLVDVIEEPDIEKMLQKHYTRVAEAAAKAVKP